MTGLYMLFLHLMDNTSPVAKLEVSASTLNSLSNSDVTNKGRLVMNRLPFQSQYLFSFPFIFF